MVVQISQNSRVSDKTTIELEKQEQDKRNILYLLLILVGVNASDLIDQTVDSSIAKVDRLRTRFKEKQDQIEDVIKQIEDISRELDELAGLDKPDYGRARKLQGQFEIMEMQVQLKMKDTAKMLQEIVHIARIEIEPLQQLLEAHQNMATRFVRVFSHQWGTDIKFK